MKNHVKTTGLIATFIALIFLGVGSAAAATIQGSVQGLNCVTDGTICPLDKADPHIAGENVFVILGKDKSYHFVPNLDRAILARYLGKEVRVTGKVNSKYNSVAAEKFDVNFKGGWKTVWTLEAERAEQAHR
ncbi:MAG: hypothetical protein BBJ57_10200 [Desulfobacterales bacterium PC51MH44]|nr:MAG: hypothetical protein BBJ57_10200 [Desulfobacterales bacterium PC51MH44]